MENDLESNDCDDIVVVAIRNLQKHFYFEDEMNTFDMASLRTLMLLEKSTRNMSGKQDNEIDDDACVQRLSLAYERLHSIPKMVLEEISGQVKILDISNNEFESLDFLNHFHQLTSLICDHNNITSKTNIPFLPMLELLWMNHCKIKELHLWARKLQFSCPNLKYLSLMKNPLILSYVTNKQQQEYLDYRLYMISLFPHLIHLDDKMVTSNERREAARRYNKHILERIVSKTQGNLPEYLRVASQRVSMMLSPSPQVSSSRKKNLII